jgi:sigma-B regulation protein RsbU (phosphoserine phosphatase)
MSARPLLDLELAAEAAALPAMRRQLCATLERLRVPAATRDRLVLAVHEACANVIRHGYGDRAGGRMRLTVYRVRQWLHFRLRDQAPALVPPSLVARDLDECRPGGLGLPIIDQTMQRWCWLPQRHRDGNVLNMWCRWSKGVS